MSFPPLLSPPFHIQKKSGRNNEELKEEKHSRPSSLLCFAMRSLTRLAIGEASRRSSRTVVAAIEASPKLEGGVRDSTAAHGFPSPSSSSLLDAPRLLRQSSSFHASSSGRDFASSPIKGRRSVWGEAAADCRSAREGFYDATVEQVRVCVC